MDTDDEYTTESTSEDVLECKRCDLVAIGTFGSRGEPLCSLHRAAAGYCFMCEEIYPKRCECEKTEDHLKRFLLIQGKAFHSALSYRNTSEGNPVEFKKWNSLCMDIQEKAVKIIMKNAFGLVLSDWMRQPL